MLLHEFLETSAKLRSDKLALVCQGRRLTYGAVNRAANSFARALVNGGFKRRSRVIVYLDNSIESVISLFGILKAGGIFALVNREVKPRKLAYLMRDCQADTLVTDLKYNDQILEIPADVPSLERIIIAGPAKLPDSAILQPRVQLLSFDALVDSEALLPDPNTQSIDLDLASLIYTSGSSGHPKGVMLTHQNMVAAATSITQYLGNTADDIILDTLPLSFDYGLYQVLMAFKIGATLILERGFVFPQQVINLIVKEKVTGWPIVPTIAAMICQLKNLDQYDFSNLRYITSTGQVLPPNHIARLRELFPQAKLYSMYGLTECKRVAYLPPEDLERKPDSVGKAMPNVEVYLVDQNGEVINQPGQPGELVVRGSNVMRGYWNLPAETDAALRPGIYPGEKVLFTGDLFKKDDEGYLYFLGRKDDIIKSAGHMVSPREVENVLCEIEGVVEAAVVGVEDDLLGRAVKGYVHLAEGSRTTRKDVVAFCHRYLEDYAVPREIVFCGPLPRTDSGKIQKRDLR
jgi:long-chain acyl-CoA synthetase